MEAQPQWPLGVHWYAIVGAIVELQTPVDLRVSVGRLLMPGAVTVGLSLSLSSVGSWTSVWMAGIEAIRHHLCPLSLVT